MTKLLKLAGAALVLGSFITVAGAASATTTHQVSPMRSVTRSPVGSIM